MVHASMCTCSNVHVHTCESHRSTYLSLRISSCFETVSLTELGAYQQTLGNLLSDWYTHQARLLVWQLGIYSVLLV